MKKWLFSILFGLFLFISCEDFNQNSSIPYAYVYLELKLNIEAVNLKGIGQTATFPYEKGKSNLGYGGILVVHALDDNYHAFDMACPHEKQRTTQVQVVDGGMHAVCTSCQSKFIIDYGSGALVEGVATEGLKRYQVDVAETVVGTILVVRNQQ